MLFIFLPYLLFRNIPLKVSVLTRFDLHVLRPENRDRLVGRYLLGAILTLLTLYYVSPCLYTYLINVSVCNYVIIFYY